MDCIIDNIDNISISGLNSCEYSAGGITDLWIANFSSDLSNSIEIFNNEIIFMDSPIKFNKIKFDEAFTKYSVSGYDYTNKKYNQVFDLEISSLDYIKRDIIDALIKAKLTIIFTDQNGRSFILGDNSPVYSVSFSEGTDVYQGKSVYNFQFQCKSDHGLFGISKDVLGSKVNAVDCTDIEGNQFYNLYLNDYIDCIIPNN